MKYLTIVLESKAGMLAKVTKVLADAEVNIEEIDADEVNNRGIMHISVRDDVLAETYETLRNAGFQVMPQTILLVEIEDRPGGLAELAVQLADADVNVRSIRIVRREDGISLCAIDPDPMETAKEVLKDRVVTR